MQNARTCNSFQARDSTRSATRSPLLRSNCAAGGGGEGDDSASSSNRVTGNRESPILEALVPLTAERGGRETDYPRLICRPAKVISTQN